MGKVVYLTGAPASGKSSTTQLLKNSVPDLLVWEYGARLTQHLNQRSGLTAQQEDIRKHSASIVAPQDIAEVDRELFAFVERNRSTRHVIIDSHPVTKEDFGFRITPFSVSQIARLAPDEIWLLYASPQETIKRIAGDPAGRATVTEEQARFHTMLQASVAATYGISLGSAVHLFDTGGNRNDLIARLRGRLQQA